MRRIVIPFAILLCMTACNRAPAVADDGNYDAEQDAALNQIEDNAQQVQAAGVILSDPNFAKPPSGEAATVQ